MILHVLNVLLRISAFATTGCTDLSSNFLKLQDICLVAVYLFRTPFAFDYQYTAVRMLHTIFGVTADKDPLHFPHSSSAHYQYINFLIVHNSAQGFTNVISNGY